MLADANTDWPDSIVRRNIEWCSAIYYCAAQHAHWNHSKVSLFSKILTDRIVCSGSGEKK